MEVNFALSDIFNLEKELKFGYLISMNYWLMKTEPQTFSIDDLKNSEKQSTNWDGVRNYQARNFMRDKMKKGDLVLIYHSSCKEVGIAGVAVVTKESHPDYSSIDKQSKYFDPKATKENPRWFMVTVKWEHSFQKIIPLNILKIQEKLKDLPLIKKGNRLSIMPVSESEYKTILNLA